MTDGHRTPHFSFLVLPLFLFLPLASPSRALDVGDWYHVFSLLVVSKDELAEKRAQIH